MDLEDVQPMVDDGVADDDGGWWWELRWCVRSRLPRTRREGIRCGFTVVSEEIRFMTSHLQ